MKETSRKGKGNSREPLPAGSPFLLGAVFLAGLLLLPVLFRLPGEKGSLLAREQKKDSSITVSQTPERRRPFRVDVNLVLLAVTVTDSDGHVQTGLDRSHFRVFEDNVEQPIASFSTEDVPISAGLLFDASGSMSDKIWKCKEAIFQFYKTANPRDEFLLLSFNDRPHVIAGFTSDLRRFLTALFPVQGHGMTALLDAVYLGLHEMKEASNSRRVLLLLSDGGDNRSRYTERDIKDAVKEADVQIFSVGMLSPLAWRGRTPEEAAGPSLLAELADLSGGVMFAVENENELPDIVEKISMQLRNQYIIGYRPSNLVRDGRWRRTKVKLNVPKGLPPLHVYVRSGYYAPSL